MEYKLVNSYVPLILAVDDDRTILMIIETMLQKQGYNVITANNGQTAQDIIMEKHELLDAIILDRMMPDIEGLEVAKWLKNNRSLTQVPIIMQTIADRPEQIKEGIDAGVFYYLTKPIQEEVLKSVIISAVRESKQKRTLKQEMNGHKLSFKLIENCEFQLQTLQEAEDLSCFLANFFPNPDVALPGLAELVINAVEHGSGNISYDEKTQLIAEGKWREELNKRIQSEPFSKKKVTVSFTKQDNKLMVKISDEGTGFKWENYLNVDPSRSMDNHGRGIARANMIFDSLQYNKIGNEVVALIDMDARKNFDW